MARYSLSFEGMQKVNKPSLDDILQAGIVELPKSVTVFEDNPVQHSLSLQEKKIFSSPCDPYDSISLQW